MQPIPPDTTLDDFGMELKMAGMQSLKCDSFVSHLITGAPTKSSVAQLLQMKDDDVKIIETASEFSTTESLLLRAVLGSMPHPFQFAKSSKGPEPSGTDENRVENKYKTGASSINFMMKASGAKGGALSAVCGELTARRERIETYYPPSEFDVEAKGSATRVLKRLRIKIIKEFEDYCGHLYPSKEERDIMLTAIQGLCGPPDNGRSWNYWFSSEAGGAVIKHKGMAISDLEKARRDPVAYGCHGTAVNGQMRPARPVRPVPVTASLSPLLQTPDNSRTSDSESAGDKDGQNPRSGDDEHSEARILANAATKEDEVMKLREEAVNKRKAAAQQKKDAAAAKRQKKIDEQAAAKEAAKTAKEAAALGAGGTSNTSKKRKQAPKDEAPEELSAYELTKLANMKSNKEWLDFLDKVSEKNCKILAKDCETIQEITTGGFAQDR